MEDFETFVFLKESSRFFLFCPNFKLRVVGILLFIEGTCRVVPSPDTAKTNSFLLGPTCYNLFCGGLENPSVLLNHMRQSTLWHPPREDSLYDPCQLTRTRIRRPPRHASFPPSPPARRSPSSSHRLCPPFPLRPLSEFNVRAPAARCTPNPVRDRAERRLSHGVRALTPGVTGI